MQSSKEKQYPSGSVVKYLFHRWLHPSSARRALFWHFFVAAMVTQFLFAYFFLLFQNIPVVILTLALLAFSIGALFRRNEVSASVTCASQLLFLIYLITSSATGSITTGTASKMETTVLVYSVVITCLTSATIIVLTLSLAVSLRLDSTTPTKEPAPGFIATPEKVPQQQKIIQSPLSDPLRSKAMPQSAAMKDLIPIEMKPGKGVKQEEGEQPTNIVIDSSTSCIVEFLPEEDQDKLVALRRSAHHVFEKDQNTFPPITDDFLKSISTTAGQTSSTSSIFNVVRNPRVKGTPRTWLPSFRKHGEPPQRLNPLHEEPLSKDRHSKDGHSKDRHSKDNYSKERGITRDEKNNDNPIDDSEVESVVDQIKKSVTKRIDRVTTALSSFSVSRAD